MKSMGKATVAALGLGLVVGFAGVLPGCGPGEAKTEYKPIESNILKKLGSSSQSQSAAAKEKLPARVKAKK